MKKMYKFDFAKGEFEFDNGNIVVLDGEDALKIWIEKAIKTAYNKYKMYNGTSYGCNISDLIGGAYKNKFMQSELQREIRDALLMNNDIYSVENFDFRQENSKLLISFDVNSIYGTARTVI